MALIHSILMGAVAGMRSLTPLATVTHAARSGRLPLDSGAPHWLSRPVVANGAMVLAAGELAGDKMKSAPDRIVIAGMAARVATGAIVGMALAPRHQRGLGALLGVAAAVGFAYLSFDLRMRAMQRHGQTATGVIEDALAVGSAVAIARSAAQRPI